MTFFGRGPAGGHWCNMQSGRYDPAIAADPLRPPGPFASIRDRIW